MRFAYLIVFSIFSITLSFSVQANNQAIKNSPSPYVAMHADDAIQWYEWNEAVLLKANKENKPIFLTIGYFSCYWCHVLQRESFKNETTAKILNDKFISVVVDRELHPVLDARLMAFAEKTLGRGGWPLNVIITPDGYPFMAAIYLPEKKFRGWLNQVFGLWDTEPDYIRSIAKDAANELNFNFTLRKKPLTQDFIKKSIDGFNHEILQTFDEMEGGFGDSAKFPLSSILQVGLSLYELNRNAELEQQLKLTLKNMFERGMYDHLAGGFFRYTTDPSWQVPHFEKMLYDNAQLASLYFRAAKVFNKVEYSDIGKQTLDFMLSELMGPDGGFYGSFSAIDDKGVEGGYYVFEKDTWATLLNNDEIKVVSIAWDWSNVPVIDEGHLPVYASEIENIAKQLGFSVKRTNRLLSSSKEKLLSLRQQRVLPRDDKYIASWNALTLVALVDGYQQTGEVQYKKVADKLAKFIVENFFINGKLQRSIHDGNLAGNADLEDYVFVAFAVDYWMQLTRKTIYREFVDELVNYAWANYFSDKGWKMSDDLLIPYGARESLLADGPMPSASSMLIQLSLRSKDKKITEKAREALEIGHNILTTQPFWYASQINVLLNQK